MVTGHVLQAATATTAGSIACAVVLQRDGQTLDNLKFTDGLTAFDPEQDVLWYKVLPGGTALTETNPSVFWTEQVKSQRKLRVGDKIVFIARTSSATADTNVDAMVQCFCRE